MLWKVPLDSLDGEIVAPQEDSTFDVHRKGKLEATRGDERGKKNDFPLKCFILRHYRDFISWPAVSSGWVGFEVFFVVKKRTEGPRGCLTKSKTFS